MDWNWQRSGAELVAQSSNADKGGLPPYETCATESCGTMTTLDVHHSAAPAAARARSNFRCVRPGRAATTAGASRGPAFRAAHPRGAARLEDGQREATWELRVSTHRSPPEFWSNRSFRPLQSASLRALRPMKSTQAQGLDAMQMRKAG
jgi:hypothetical protein